MTNVLYPLCKQAFLGAEIDVTSDVLKVQLVDITDYTWSDTHEFLTDVPVAARVGTAVTLGNVTRTGGVMDADNVTFTAVTGDEAEALVIYQDTGVEATSRLMAYIDDATGLPVIPNGGNIDVIWDSGPLKIFAI